MSEDMLDMREERSIENMVESAAVLIDVQALETISQGRI